VKVMVFDVESVGLHGEGFAVAHVVYDLSLGYEVDHGFAWTHPASASGPAEGRAWVAEHVLPHLGKDTTHDIPEDVREYFWRAWRAYAEPFGSGAFLPGHMGAPGPMLFADCAWPVEARFLAECIDDAATLKSVESKRAWQGPFPLYDVSSFLMAAGLDPKMDPPVRGLDRRFLPASALAPKHHPLADARGSVNKLLAALEKLGHPLLPPARM
jgi:hypothetical protein